MMVVESLASYPKVKEVLQKAHERQQKPNLRMR